ncbi:MAG: AtpZ/AtpI family protein [Gemmatimonadales bacterium]|nr:AtpZ/AtpI family protein [Gemmatimonadales bacterium]
MPSRDAGSDGRAMGEGYKSLALGLKFAGGIMLYAGMGFLVDRKLGTLPIGVIAGTVLGSGLSFYSVYRTLTRLEADAKAKLAARRDGAGTTTHEEDGR